MEFLLIKLLYPLTAGRRLNYQRGETKLAQHLLIWISDNKSWIFSGIGVTFVVGLWYLVFGKNRDSIAQKITSGDRSINLQAGGDINVTDQE